MQARLCVDDGKELAPRANCLRVLLGHRLDDLTEVVEIVDHPRGEELPERHLPKGGMETPSLQVFRCDERAEGLEIRGPYGCEPVQKIAKLPAPESGEPSLPVDRPEEVFRAVLEDHPRPVD